MTKAEKIYEKLKDAPQDVVQEVLDFIGYLGSQEAPATQATALNALL